MNKVILIGRICSDLNVYKTNEFEACTFTVACNRYKDASDFIRCRVTGRQVDIMERISSKGSMVSIVGSWETGSYDDASGNKVYTNTCNVREISIIDKKRSTEESYGTNRLRGRTSGILGNTNVNVTAGKLEEKIDSNNNDEGIIQQAFDIDMSDEFI